MSLGAAPSLLSLSPSLSLSLSLSIPCMSRLTHEVLKPHPEPPADQLPAGGEGGRGEEEKWDIDVTQAFSVTVEEWKRRSLLLLH